MILPVILSGGAGSRLWPLSTAAVPKQFLPIVGARSMIAETAARFDSADFFAPATICNAAHADIVAAEVGGEGAILLEPVGRNTAPAAVVAAMHAKRVGAELVFLAPADHHVRDVEALRAAVAAATPAAEVGNIVTFGISPTSPETGYGYIRMAKAISGEVRRVAEFVEKPDLATARGYLADGGYAWNAGLFLFRPDTLLDEIRLHAADVLEPAVAAYVKAAVEGREIALDAESFAACRAESIDYAVMEKTARAACLAVDIGWSDIGSFASLHAVAAKDADGNSLNTAAGAKGAVGAGARAVDASGCLVVSDGTPVGLVGVEGVGVVVRGGEILVVGLDHSQSVKALVDDLKRDGETDRL